MPLRGALLVVGLLAGAPAFAKDSVADLSALISQDPGNGALLLRRASANRDGGDVESALADLELAAALPGGGALGHHPAGLILLELGRDRAALQRFDAALARAPERLDSRRGRARALWRLGRTAESAAAFEALFGADEVEPQAWEDYASLLADAAPPRLRQAVAVLDRGLSRGPDPNLALYAIDLEVRRLDWIGALRHLDALLAASARKDYLFRRRGEVLELAGRRCEAITAYRAGLAAIATLPHELRATRPFLEAQADLEARVRRLAGAACAAPGAARLHRLARSVDDKEVDRPLAAIR